jgi:ABC-type antimicrobial peptide transport system permease subunit
MLGILYLIIAFGVFGTVLMMTNERKKEFGVLISIGMQRTRLAIVLGVEMFYIGLLGIISSIIVSIPIILYGVSNPVHLKGDEAKMLEGYGFDPVLKFANIGDYFFWQSLIVVIIVIIATYYPARKILRLNEVQAIRT